MPGGPLPEPKWVPLDRVISINKEITERSGKPHAIQDLAALQKAVAHPWNKWVYFMDRDIAVLAGTLFASIGAAHGFAACNKQSAYRAAAEFVEANGYRLDLGDSLSQAVGQLMAFFDGKLSHNGVVEWYRTWIELF